MKITTKTALEMYGALAALDGYTKSAGPDKQPIIVPYQLSDATRLKIVRNRRRLRPITEEADELRLAILRDVTKGAAHIEASNEAAKGEFNARWHETAKAEHEVELLPMTYEELLHGDKNPIPGAVLEALGPLTTE